MATRTANTGSNNWNTNAAWVGGVQPTAADDVVIPASAVVTIPSATTVLGRSLTVQASGTLAWAASSSQVSLGDATAGSGNVALSISSSATITLTGIGTINFVSTSATQQTITTGGKTLPNIVFNGVGASWIQSDALTMNVTANITLTNGTYATGNFNVTTGRFLFTTAGTRTFSPGSSALSCASSINGINIQNPSGFTLSTNTAILTCTSNGTAALANTSQDMAGMSLVMPNGPGGIFGGIWKDVTLTGSINKTDTVSLGASMTVTGTLTINSNSLINRILVATPVRGTQATITAAALVLGNIIDFMDIAGAGAATWTKAATGATELGDCGGNSGITFSTPATQTFAGGAGNWSDVSLWTSRVPLPQDDVVVNTAAAGTLIVDMPRMGKNINFTSFAGNANFNTATEFYGSLTMSGSATYSTAAGSLTAAGRGSYNITWNGASITWSSAASFQVNAPSGTYTMQDNVTVGQTNAAIGSTVTNGTLASANGLTHSFGSIATLAGGSLSLGNSTWNLTATGAITIWNINVASTVTASVGSVINIANASTNSRTVALGAGKSYSVVVRYTVAGSTGTLVSASSATIYDVEFSDATNARTFSLANLLTLTSPTPLTNFRGTSGKLMTLNSNTAGTRRQMSLGFGWSNTDYLNIQDIQVLEPYKLFAGANSTSGGNNINVNLTAPIAAPLPRLDAPLVTVSAALTGTATFSGPTVAGELLIGILGNASTMGATTAPAGWTKADEKIATSHVVVFYKIADGTETGFTPTWANSSNAQLYGWAFSNWSGKVPTLDTVAESSSGSAASLLTGTATNSAAPAISIAAFAANGSMGASSLTTLPTNNFEENYNSQQTTGALIKFAALPLTASAAQSTTVTWTTSRVPVSVLVNFIGVTAPTNMLMYYGPA